MNQNTMLIIGMISIVVILIIIYVRYNYIEHFTADCQLKCAENQQQPPSTITTTDNQPQPQSTPLPAVVFYNNAHFTGGRTPYYGQSSGTLQNGALSMEIQKGYTVKLTNTSGKTLTSTESVNEIPKEFIGTVNFEVSSK